MNCLLDHIGIEGCGEVTPPSNLFINRLPGIELKAIDKLATPDQVNFQGVWDDIQERAVRKFKTKVNAQFKERWKLKTITSSIDIGKKLTEETTSQAAEYRGYTIELNQEGSDFANSNMQVIFIKSLPLYLSTAQNTTIKIYDLDIETEIYTSTVTGSQGWNIVSINEYFTENRIYVVYDSTTIDSNQQDITKLMNYNSGSGCDCLCYDFNNSEFRIRGAKSLISDKFDISYVNDTYGLSGLFSIQCSYDSIVCNNLPVFETALWYLLGAEFCFERRFTSRLNEFTTFDKNKAKELEEEYIKRFEEELSIAIDGINLNGNDSCLVCNEQFRYTDARL